MRSGRPPENGPRTPTKITNVDDMCINTINYQLSGNVSNVPNYHHP